MVESDIIYEGILNEKRIGDSLGRTKKVILYKTELLISSLQDASLVTENANTASYRINIYNCIVAPINKDKFKTPNCFEIYCSANQKTYYFQCDSASLVIRWIDNIKTCAENMKKAQNNSKGLLSSSDSNILTCCLANNMSTLVFVMDIKISGLLYKVKDDTAKFKGFTIDNGKRALFAETAPLSIGDPMPEIDVALLRNITQDELERVKEIAILIQLVQPGLFSDTIIVECRITLDTLIKRNEQIPHRYPCLIVNKFTPSLFVSSKLIIKNTELAEEFLDSRLPQVNKKIEKDVDSDAKSQSSVKSNASAGRFMKKKDDDSKSVSSIGSRTPRGEKFLKVKSGEAKDSSRGEKEDKVSRHENDKYPGCADSARSIQPLKLSPQKASEPSFNILVEGVVSERSAIYPVVKDGKSAGNFDVDSKSSHEVKHKHPAGAIQVLPPLNMSKVSEGVESKFISDIQDVESKGISDMQENSPMSARGHSIPGNRQHSSRSDDEHIQNSSRSDDKHIPVEPIINVPKRQLSINVDSDVSREVRISTPVSLKNIQQPPKLKETNKKANVLKNQEFHDKLGLAPDLDAELVEPHNSSRKNNERRRLDGVGMEKSDIKNKKALLQVRTSMGVGCIIS